MKSILTEVEKQKLEILENLTQEPDTIKKYTILLDYTKSKKLKQNFEKCKKDLEVA